MNSSSTDPKEIRKFGLIALLFFGLLAVIAGWREKTALTLFFSLPAVLGTLLLILPDAMAPVYHGWVRVGGWIGRGFTVVMLTIVYYLVISPYGLVMRAFGRHPLPLKPDGGVHSYWVTRPESAQPKKQFYKRY